MNEVDGGTDGQPPSEEAEKAEAARTSLSRGLAEAAVGDVRPVGWVTDGVDPDEDDGREES